MWGRGWRSSRTRCAKVAADEPCGVAQSCYHAVMKSFTLRLDDRQANLLDAVARLDNKPAAQVLREALNQHINQRFKDPGFQERLRRAAEETQRLLDLTEEER